MRGRGGEGSGAFRSVFLIVFDKEPSGTGRRGGSGAFRSDLLIVFDKEPWVKGRKGKKIEGR